MEKNIKLIEKKDLSITKTYDLAKPLEAVAMAEVLKNMVVKQKLYSNIKGKNFAHVDAWQMAGFLTGLNVIIDEPKNLSNEKEIKWSCVAKVYSGEKLVSMGYALCSSKESTKKSFDEYAILSMAQTRSIGKAYRNKIGWIMKLAGMEGTPSEEMMKVGEEPIETIDYDSGAVSATKGDIRGKVEVKKGQIIGPDGKPSYICSGCDDLIGDPAYNFSMKVYKRALCRNCQSEVKHKK